MLKHILDQKSAFLLKEKIMHQKEYESIKIEKVL